MTRSPSQTLPIASRLGNRQQHRVVSPPSGSTLSASAARTAPARDSSVESHGSSVGSASDSDVGHRSRSESTEATSHAGSPPPVKERPTAPKPSPRIARPPTSAPRVRANGAANHARAPFGSLSATSVLAATKTLRRLAIKAALASGALIASNWDPERVERICVAAVKQGEQNGQLRRLAEGMKSNQNPAASKPTKAKARQRTQRVAAVRLAPEGQLEVEFEPRFRAKGIKKRSL